MPGLSFILRTLSILLTTGLVVGALFLFIVGLNRIFRFFFDAFGVEIFDTWDWISAKAKRAKRRKAYRKMVQTQADALMDAEMEELEG